MTEPKRATFKAKQGAPFAVHFNPASLDYTITNTLKGGGDTREAQYVSQSTGKLAMELVFDTTGTGEDVRLHTGKVADLMKPEAQPGQSSQTPAVAVFEWGEYKFEGIIDSYREKIDFFSADGVPLRATVNLSMTRQDQVFASGNKADAGGAPPADAVEAPLGAGRSAEDIAAQAGAPAAARALAAANGLESLRLPNVAAIRLPLGVPLAPPLPFAPGAASAAGAPASGSAAAGPDSFEVAAREPDLGGDGPAADTASARSLASAGGRGRGPAQNPASRGAATATTAAATPGASTSPALDRRSAGVPAAAGAFAGLRQPRGDRGAARLDPGRVLQPLAPGTHGAGAEVGYRLGGQVLTLGAGSMTADVGQTVDLAERIRFDRGDGGHKR